MATNLIDLIDKVNADDLPTNEFTIEEEDPMVILGKLNEVIAYLQTLQATINTSDSKANEALQNAIEAVSTANTALSASNTALNTANTAISTANTALSSANNAVETALNADSKADTAITTANGAKGTAEGIDAKATQALENSQTAISTANTANSKAQEALDQVVGSLGTKVYRDTTLLSNLDIKPIEEQINTNTADIAQALGEIAELDADKVSKVSGKQLSTEDFTTAEKNKLAGLNNYDDSQIKSDITTNSLKITNLENSNFLKGGLGSISNYTPNYENDLNKLFNQGVYSYYNNPTNLPSGFAGWGICIVLSGGEYKTQILIGNFGSPLLAIRNLDPANNQWVENWTTIS